MPDGAAHLRQRIPGQPAGLSAWISPRDMISLVRCAIQTPQPGFALVWAGNPRAYGQLVSILGKYSKFATTENKMLVDQEAKTDNDSEITD